MYQLISIITVILYINLVQPHTNKCNDYRISTEDIQNAFVASKACYNKNLEVSQVIPKSKFVVTLDVEKTMDNGHTVRVIVAEKLFTTIVAFRGFDDDGLLTQVVRDSLTKLKGTPVVFDSTLVSVNTYFWEAFKILYKPLKNKLQDQARKYIITGHSLGGALASLLAITAKEDEGRMWENPSTSLITFGQPRVGNKEFAEKHDQMIPSLRKLRFVHNYDPVPHIPLWPEAVHHSREVWISERILSLRRTWFWKVCSPGDPLKCSNMWTFTPEMKDHSILSYENHIMSPPVIFYDKRHNQHLTWLEALQYTCETDLILSK